MTAPEVKVTQSDRNAADAWQEAHFDDSEWFPSLVQAFARHRATATAPLEARIALLEGGMGEAVGALHPFAKEAEQWPNEIPDDFVPDMMDTESGDELAARFTVGDIRAARTTLASLSAMLEGGK